MLPLVKKEPRLRPRGAASFHDGNQAEHKEASMRDRKALKAITNAIMKAHVDVR